MNIKLLSPLVANQIAAGEVIERPASVVKELIENSIDAGASKIDISIEDGGKKLIKITDDGSGIYKDELVLALARHATSKISSLDDLDSIASFGFRGEALASIAAVARLSIISKPQDQSVAWQVHIEGSADQPVLKPASHNNGTSMIVEDLFFNLPARRRFLKSNKTEIGHIQDIVVRIILANPTVSFTYSVDGKIIYKLNAAKTEEQEKIRIEKVLCKNFISEAKIVQSTRDNIEIYGYVLMPPTVTDSTPETQLLFLNGRVIRDRNIIHAIKQSYTETFHRDVKINFLLFLTINPSEFDINVHPAKHEVRFSEPRKIHDFVVVAVNNAFEGAVNLIEYESEIDNSILENTYGSNISSIQSNDYVKPTLEQNYDFGNINLKDKPSSSFSLSSNLGQFSNNNYASRDRNNISKTYSAYQNWTESVLGNEEEKGESVHLQQSEQKIIEANNFEFYGLLGGIACIGYQQTLYKVDLKKIEENKLKKFLNDQQVQSTTLMLPIEIKIEVNNLQSDENVKLLKSLGFNTICKNNHSIKTVSIPSVLRHYNLSDILYRIFEYIQNNKDTDKEQLIEILVKAAINEKKYAIYDAIRIISENSVEQIINDLDAVSIIEIEQLLK